MDLRQLRGMLAVIEAGSLGKAAERLHMSQPALTKSIKRLEDDLGVSLFVRGARGMHPTVFADSLQAYAQAASVGMAQAVSQIKALKSGTEGIVTIAAPPIIGSELFPDALIKLTNERPNLRLRVVLQGNDLFASLLAGRYDLIVATLYSEIPPTGLLWRQLFIDRMVAITRPNHALASRGKMSFADLREYPWAVADGESRHRRRLEHFFAAAGLQPPQAAIECSTPSLVRALVMRSDYVGIVAKCGTEAD
ncbi:MAG TPA: LysR family transcriptional regulator, partial [Beijerinckiaceae bacterium]|nr:LysR family transcriptional regulator [Beijerinckiaceae bacterium]